MRYIIIGAGAIGGAIGGRLHDSGHDVVLVARGRHHDTLRDRGLRLRTPDGDLELSVPVAGRPEDVGLRPDDVLVLAVKTQDSGAALDAWAHRPVEGGGTAARRLPLICAQNGVENERLALRRFQRVYGMCVWLPATHVEPGEVTVPCGPYAGALTLGRFPSGQDDVVRRMGADLEKSGFLAPVVDHVMRWKYAKLVTNLGNAVNALCGPGAGPEAKALAERAREEGAAVLDAAGTDRASAGELSELVAGKVEMRPVAGVQHGRGSSWQSLARGSGTIESDFLNGEIVLLGRLHGIATPVNEALREAANEAARAHRPPGSMTGAELGARVDAFR
ncbi:ketopantoate reductase family protein [Streptomyces meridianus]|uniref:Ketopantoate reductase family protein n=1 Tax=Streptomyces meridianus TaxID=2938945 RepID=A0ABT0X453_9ACTN|nr:2-dehydropantoate 2-reductase N-terminal domain-containing protein [Streptomyces meridianus]MCM2577326.1 ketopantoate reductase family protein [Streptomyces meridianus]